MKNIKPWGKSLALDLYDCKPETLVDPEGLKKFVQDTIDLIGMVAHGPCYVDRFAEGNLEGYSAMQFLKTSSITVHLDEEENRAFIDVFSCKDFDAAKAEEFAKNYFGAQSAKSVILSR